MLTKILTVIWTIILAMIFIVILTVMLTVILTVIVTVILVSMGWPYDGSDYLLYNEHLDSASMFLKLFSKTIDWDYCFGTRLNGWHTG